MSAHDKLVEQIRTILADDNGPALIAAIAEMRAAIVLTADRRTLFTRGNLSDATVSAAASLTRIIALLPAEKRQARLSEFLRIAQKDNTACGCITCRAARAYDDHAVLGVGRRAS